MMLGFVRVVRRASLAAVGLALSVAGVCLAESPSPSASSPQPSNTVGAVFTDAGQLLIALAALLLFALAAVGFVLLFVRDSEAKYFMVARRLARLGEATAPVVVGATAPPLQGLADMTPIDLKVVGPPTISVGSTAEYSASSSNRDAGGTAWSIAPSDAATLTPATGSSTKVSPTKPGTLTVKASLETATASIEVTASATAGKSTTLPFIGAGWGSIVVAIIVASLASALGLAGKLGTDSLAVIFGTLIGYVFANRTSAPPAAGIPPKATEPTSGQ